MYLIPFPAISRPTFPISRLKKWQITRPVKALLGPCQLISDLETLAEWASVFKEWYTIVIQKGKAKKFADKKGKPKRGDRLDKGGIIDFKY